MRGRLLLGCGLVGALAWLSSSQEAPRSDRLLLLPFTVDAARALVPVSGKVLIYNPGRPEERAQVDRLAVRVGGALVVQEALTSSLPGDPEYGRLNALIERLPEELGGHRHTRAFAAEGEPTFTGDEALGVLREVEQGVEALRSGYAAGLERPFVEPEFTLPLDVVFAPEDPVGTRATLSFEVDYRIDGVARTVRAEREIEWLGPWPEPPTTTFGSLAVHRGDLHVHSCHGEAVNACAPSGDCAAETLQTSGSFSYAQLKSQYQALGLDWFTATDHSYCIDSDSEYLAVTSEVAALTDASFLALPDLEVSSDEIGPQVGSDSGDLACVGTTSANHLGAHGLSSRIAGGSEGFLGFCDGLFSDVLDDFEANIAAVRAQGGYAIAHHPVDSFGWNSYSATDGQESLELHGVEIWNGAFQSGQGGNVGRWVDWLLDGRVLYGYAGSDTHDAAFDFGANHAILLDEPFGEASVEAAMRAGRLYLSNGPALTLEVDGFGETLFMGRLKGLPQSPSAEPLTVRAAYDFGGDTGVVSLYRGRVGDASETLLCQSGPLTGAGTFECADTLITAAWSYYRAYAENGAGDEAAYTNPVFLLVGNSDPTLALDASPATLSLAGGGTQVMDLDAGLEHRERVYWLLGSSAGTSPGLPLGEFLFPLNFDGSSGYLLYTALNPNTPPLAQSLGFLDGLGRGAAGFVVPPASDPTLAGVVLNHAYAVYEPFPTDVVFVSGARPIQLVP